MNDGRVTPETLVMHGVLNKLEGRKLHRLAGKRYKPPVSIPCTKVNSLTGPTTERASPLCCWPGKLYRLHLTLRIKNTDPTVSPVSRDSYGVLIVFLGSPQS